jgi:hypothetical protein
MPSSARQPREAGLRIRVAPEEVTLDTWPLRQRPVSSLAVVASGIAVSWLVGWAANHWAVGAIAAAALAITLWRAWLPVRYEIGGGGITQVLFGRWRRRIPWTAILQFQVLTDGVLLLPDASVTPLSALRGLYLPWGRHRDAVLANLDYYLHGWRTPARHSTHNSSRPQHP